MLMARMHARRRGKSRSRKPGKKAEWVEYEKDEIEKIIIKLAKQGKNASIIGIVLRDQYGIPDVRDFGLRITKVLEKHNILPYEVPEDMYMLLKKAVRLHEHLQKHKKDKLNIHNLQLIESKIRRLVTYYKNKGKLPKDWKYTIERAKLIVE